MDRLPNELVTAIAFLLDLDDIESLSLVSKRFNLVSAPARYRYYQIRDPYSLALALFVNHPKFGIPAEEKAGYFENWDEEEDVKLQQWYQRYKDNAKYVRDIRFYCQALGGADRTNDDRMDELVRPFDLVERMDLIDMNNNIWGYGGLPFLKNIIWTKAKLKYLNLEHRPFYTCVRTDLDELIPPTLQASPVSNLEHLEIRVIELSQRQFFNILTIFSGWTPSLKRLSLEIQGLCDANLDDFALELVGENSIHRKPGATKFIHFPKLQIFESRGKLLIYEAILLLSPATLRNITELRVDCHQANEEMKLFPFTLSNLLQTTSRGRLVCIQCDDCNLFGKIGTGSRQN